ncbi:hypothetical protein F5B18DRAFT_399748 [Nemania serpens]|nr:hypothetical protein F5B18DRAFT_399748 [Nemania serpens]
MSCLSTLSIPPSAPFCPRNSFFIFMCGTREWRLESLLTWFPIHATGRGFRSWMIRFRRLRDLYLEPRYAFLVFSLPPRVHSVYSSFCGSWARGAFYRLGGGRLKRRLGFLFIYHLLTIACFSSFLGSVGRKVGRKEVGGCSTEPVSTTSMSRRDEADESLPYSIHACTRVA